MSSDYAIAFWFLVGTALLSIIGIILAAKSIGALVQSDFFIDKMKKLKDKDSVKTIVLLLLSSIPGSLMAQVAEIVPEPLFEIGLNQVVIMVVVNLFFLSILLLLYRILQKLVDQVSPVRVKKVKEKKKRFSSKLNRALTGMVDIADEKSILMDHDFDGIQELDNNLPPWWKYGFYLSIVVSIGYMIHFHALGTGDLQAEEYKKEVAEAEAAVTAYLEASALNVDENTVVMMMDAGDLAKGKGIFIKYCAVCHLNDGGGQVGPNMTDDHWLYGPDMKSIFKTIKYGANNGMTSWKEKLTPVEMQQVSSYIRTLHGTTPAISKDPQGTLMPFDGGTEVAADSTEVMAASD